VTGILFSRWTGSLVDKYHKLNFVRASIIVQKLSALLAYTSFMIMLSFSTSMNPFQPPHRRFVEGTTSFFTPVFALLVISSCVLHLSNTSISIAVERDWATCISQGPDSSTKLAKLNTYLRQINLFCKLFAPLFISFLTVKLDYNGDEGNHNIVSVRILALVTLLSLFFELYWIGVVYKRFPELEADQQKKERERRNGSSLSNDEGELPISGCGRASNVLENLLHISDWRELVHLPIFFSSLSISLLYLTVLS